MKLGGENEQPEARGWKGERQRCGFQLCAEETHKCRLVRRQISKIRKIHRERNLSLAEQVLMRFGVIGDWDRWIKLLYKDANKVEVVGEEFS